MFRRQFSVISHAKADGVVSMSESLSTLHANLCKSIPSPLTASDDEYSAGVVLFKSQIEVRIHGMF